MCGFLALFSNAPSQPSSEELRHCASRLKHRGNSSEGFWQDEQAKLFHYRLAFRDLQQGQQPMQSSKDQSVIVFNGELYDFASRKSALNQNYDFKTLTDTEVLLAQLIENPAQVFSALDGEFAFVHWNPSTKKIIAGRDSFGVKPIFFWSPQLVNAELRNFRDSYPFEAPTTLAFASEIKGLPGKRAWCAHGSLRQLLGLYEEMGTAYENVFQIPPGSLFEAKLEGNIWKCTIKRIATPRRGGKREINFWDSADLLEKAVASTVKNKLDSDVPLGVYLSGGIDSRIAAFELSKYREQIESFTVGFEGADYDESEAVKSFAQSHKFLKPRLLKTTDAALAYSYRHAIYHSEMIQPYTNGCAKWWLSRFARRYVRGVLTGDGSDEVFCGYPSYRYLAWWQFYQRNPTPARGKFYRAKVEGKNAKFWEAGLSSQSDGQDLLRAQALLGWFYPLMAQAEFMAKIYFGSEKGAVDFLKSVRESIFSYVSQDIQDQASPLQTWQNYFLRTHFPTHVLNWVGDRMEMANTLEGRPIFLSKQIFETISHAPDHHLVRGLRDKAVLRQAYQDKIGNFARAPKKQFNAPFLFSESAPQSALNNPEIWKRVQSELKNKDPLKQSYARMLNQNLVVASLLEESLIQGNAFARDLDFEENFLDNNISEIK